MVLATGVRAGDDLRTKRLHEAGELLAYGEVALYRGVLPAEVILQSRHAATVVLVPGRSEGVGIFRPPNIRFQC